MIKNVFLVHHIIYIVEIIYVFKIQNMNKIKWL